MGYNTYYELSVDKNEDAIAEYIERMDDSDLHYYLEYYGGEWSGEGKWYDHTDDMTILSSKFPDVLFTLTGDGEDRDDLWVKYFKNGKVQVAKAQITYEPFDEGKLK